MLKYTEHLLFTETSCQALPRYDLRNLNAHNQLYQTCIKGYQNPPKLVAFINNPQKIHWKAMLPTIEKVFQVVANLHLST